MNQKELSGANDRGKEIFTGKASLQPAISPEHRLFLARLTNKLVLDRLPVWHSDNAGPSAQWACTDPLGESQYNVCTASAVPSSLSDSLSPSDLEDIEKAAMQSTLNHASNFTLPIGILEVFEHHQTLLSLLRAFSTLHGGRYSRLLVVQLERTLSHRLRAFASACELAKVRIRIIAVPTNALV